MSFKITVFFNGDKDGRDSSFSESPEDKSLKAKNLEAARSLNAMIIKYQPQTYIISNNKRKASLWPQVKHKKLSIQKSIFSERAKKYQSQKHKLFIDNMKKA